MTRLVRPLLAGWLALAALAAAGDAAASKQAAPAPPAPAATPTPAPQEPEIQDFVPSEKVGADDAVSFPTDI